MKILRTYILSMLFVGLFAISALAAGVPPDGSVNNCEVKKVVCINKTTSQKVRGIVDPPGYYSCGPNFSQNDGDKVVIKIICLSREPACIGQSCGTYTGDCDPNIGPCYCWKTIGGGTACGDDIYCNSTSACSSDADCPAGMVCGIEDCCGFSPGTCLPATCSGTIWGGEGGDGGSTAVGR